MVSGVYKFSLNIRKFPGYAGLAVPRYINTIIWLLKNAIAGIVIQRISVISHSDRKGGKDFQYKR